METDTACASVTAALKRGGFQGLVTAVPVAAWLHTKQKNAIVELLGCLDESRLLALRSPQAGRELVNEATKLAMKDPIVLGALVIGASATHGAWRGWHRTKPAHRQHEGFVRQEEQRRTQQSESPAMRG